MNYWQLLYKARVIIDFLVYAGGSLLSRAISFFILPLIMHRIDPAQYGILSLITAFNTFATALMGLGLRQVLSLEYFHAQDHKKAHLIGDILIIYTILALPTCVLLWLNKSSINSILFFNQLENLQFTALLVNAFLFFYVELMYQLMQYRRQAQQSIIIQATIAILNATLCLITVFYYNAGISGIIAAQCISTLLAAYSAYRYLKQDYYESPAITSFFAKISYYIPYGLPFIPTILANWMLSSADRWVLGYYCSMHDVGIYSVADLASQLFYTIILLPWAGSYLPYIMQRYQSNPGNIGAIEKENKQIMWISMLVMLIAISISLPLANIVLYQILPPAYMQAVRYVWLLLVGQIFLLGSYFCSTYIQYRKKTYFLALALFVPATINLLLNLLLAPSYGIMGCTVATLISYVLYFIMTYLFGLHLQGKN